LQDPAKLKATRRIWLDCIRINQEDGTEKEVQIPLMAEIYSKAERTIVWLSDEPDAEQVLSLLQDLEGRPRLIGVSNGFPDQILDHIAQQEDERPMGFAVFEGVDLHFKALAHLLQNKWFFRI
jgi:hypothetical protein